MSGLTPTQWRTLDGQASARYSELSRQLALRGDAPAALATQVSADTHKVMAGLWLKASGAHNPLGAFMAMASKVVRPMLPLGGGTDDVATVVDAVRSAWATSLRPLNVPTFFSPLEHLIRLGPVGEEQVRHRMVGDAATRDFLARTSADVRADPTRLDLVVQVHLVRMAEQVGDDALVSALARWLLVQSMVDPAKGGGPAAVAAAAAEALGPVEMIRLQATRRELGA